MTPLTIAWEHIEPSDFLKGRIEGEVASLERRFGRITSVQVTVEGRNHRHHKGGLYAVRVRLTLPGGIELDATRNPDADHAHEDAYVAIRDAFAAMQRQLRERVRARRQQARAANPQPHGIVSELATDHGFIRADDGREIYFHQNAVLSEFARLRVGVEVHFAEDEGADGPQASTVRAYGVSAKS